MAITFAESVKEISKIKIIGIGGAGNNAINTMIRQELTAVKFLAVNTDLQDLNNCVAENKLQIGRQLVKGCGVGGVPERGREAAEEQGDEILQELEGVNVVLLTAGMGGGTGTGAISYFAKKAQEKGALSLAIVTYPFSFEGNIRKDNADKGLEELKKYTNALIIIPNDRILEYNNDLLAFDAFEKVDLIQHNTAKTLTDIISKSGYINVDGEDLKTILSQMGYAHVGLGVGEGENRAQDAVNNAIANPLMYSISLEHSKAVLVNVTVGYDLRISEWEEIGQIIQQKTNKEVNYISGLILDKKLKDKLYVSLIATGIPDNDVATEVVPHIISEKSHDEEAAEIEEILNRIHTEDAKAFNNR